MTANGTAQMDRRKLQDRVPLDAITAEARKARPGRTLLGLIGGALWLAGYVTAKVFVVLWFSLAWCFSAVKVGWREARGQALTQPSLEEVMRENARLRAELSRVS